MFNIQLPGAHILTVSRSIDILGAGALILKVLGSSASASSFKITNSINVSPDVTYINFGTQQHS
jgi:hypothetical protein